MDKHTLNNMGRTEIIITLGKYAHPVWYHDVLHWDTNTLRALLYYYAKS